MKTSPFPLSYTAAWGMPPTVIVATTRSVVSLITLTVFEPAFMTNTSPLPLS